MRARAGGLAGPSSGRSPDGDLRGRDARATSATACALVVEAFRVGRDDLAAAPKLQGRAEIRHRILRNIDTAACAEKGVKVLTLRRRANISCAEQAFALDAGAGAQARRARWPGHRRAHRREAARSGRSTAATRPARNYARVGGLRAAQRCDHRHHWPGRDRARDCAAGRGLRHAGAVPPAHARTGDAEERELHGALRAAADAARRKRLDRAATADQCRQRAT